jgi:hypothetical protein
MGCDSGHTADHGGLLADVPDSSLGNVFVVTTGAMPIGRTGPIGYHPDDLDTAPGARRFLTGYCPAAEPKITLTPNP